MSKNICFHCHEDIPKGVNITATIKGNIHPMCCYGCKAVAEFIDEGGYCEFYDYRGEAQPASKAQVADEKWLAYDESINFQTYSKKTSSTNYSVSLKIEGVYCSACGWLIDKHLKQLNGIKDIKLNTITKRLQVEFDVSKVKLSEVLTAINYLGYEPILNTDEDSQQFSFNERKTALKRLVVAGFGMMFVMTLSVPLYSSEYQGMEPQIKRFFLLISLLVSTWIYFYSGKTFLQNAYRDLRNKHLGMDVPIALSITIAYTVSSWNVLSQNGQTTYFDSLVMFVFFLLAGRFVEMTVRHQGMSVNEALSSMIPVSVKLFDNEHIENIPYANINKGDLIQIQAGEVVAIDGVIIQGLAKVNESLITGEATAINKIKGDTVLAGSSLDSGDIIIKSIAIGDETILASLSQLLENAQLQKPKTLMLVDKIASWFIAIILLLATLTAIYYSAQHSENTIAIVLAVLVATCPCALSLATPAALTAASVRLMKRGVLINNLDAITKINKTQYWFIDKTGTLTEPYMSIHKIHNISDKSDSEILTIMATLEHKSSHPIASAFNDFYDKSLSVKERLEKPGLGTQATIGTDIYKAGNKQWCDIYSDIKVNNEKTVIYLCQNKKTLAAFELQNKLRKGTSKLIKFLQNKHQHITILSGDKDTAVAKVARTLSIDDYLAEKTPEQKINIIKCQQKNSPTIMVGDGINDAPVLAQSDVSISFNQGTQLARAASDFIIMGRSLDNIIDLLNISKKTNHIIKQNIIWALLYNLSITPLAIMGYLTPWMAAIGMSISSLFVVLNAKRILFK